MIAPIPALAPSDDIAALLQYAACGALIGTAIAAHRRARDADVDAGLITARWSIAAGALAVAILIVDQLGLL